MIARARNWTDREEQVLDPLSVGRTAAEIAATRAMFRCEALTTNHFLGGKPAYSSLHAALGSNFFE